MHPRPVIGLDRLGHEGCGLAIGVGNLMHDIFVDLHPVGGLHQRAEGQSQFMLRCGDFVVVFVTRKAHFEHRGDHFAADIDGAVDRRDREITTLGARAVAHVAAVIFLRSVARQFDIVDRKARSGIAIFKPHIVEHEEFSLGADIDGITDPG